MTEKPLPNIDHVVVVMMENRSFDNVLGWLSTKGVEGLSGTPTPSAVDGLQANAPLYPAQYGSAPTNPNPDPNEEYQYVWRQLSNTFPSSLEPPLPPPNVTMQGFINDYAQALLKEDPTGTIPATQIMDCFTPEQLPVISALADAYTVCDQWFCSVPSQTFTNRSFAHAGTASGYVNNSWKQSGFPPIGFFVNDTPTIYNLLEAAGIPWRIYYGSTLLLCQAFQNQKQLQQYGWGSQRRFFPMAQFYSDIASAETFPSYVFIEPNFIGNPWCGPETDMHPQASPVEEDGPSNVMYGEQLLYDVYTALTQSPEWSSTLLVILFDEHGGTFDHVPPPATISPDGVTVSNLGGWSFGFDRLGVRVPAVMVSPWIPSSVCSTQFDHTSLLRTLMEQFDLPSSLGARAAQANDLSGVVSTTCNTAPVPLTNPNATWTRDQFTIDDAKLSGFQKELLALAIITAGDVFEAADFGGLLGDLLDHIGRDVYSWFAKLDKKAEAWPLIELLMRAERAG
jgi:phospholipase C